MNDINPHSFFSYKLFTNDEVDKILSLSEDYFTQEAAVGGGISGIVDKSYRISDVKWLSKSEKTKWIYKKIYDAIIYANSHYKFKIKGLETLQLTYYNGNEKGKYDLHVDTSSFLVNQKKYMRKITISILLSNHNDFEGGELLLIDSGKDVIPKHKTGHAIIFPSFLPHRVFPVLEGRRISLVGWVYGEPFV